MQERVDFSLQNKKRNTFQLVKYTMQTFIQFMEAKRSGSDERSFLMASIEDLRRSDWTTSLIYADWLEERGDPLGALIRYTAAEQMARSQNAGRVRDRNPNYPTFPEQEIQRASMSRWRNKEEASRAVYEFTQNPSSNWFSMPGFHHEWVYKGPDPRRQGVRVYPNQHDLTFSMMSKRPANREGSRYGFQGRKMHLSEVDTELLKAGFAMFVNTAFTSNLGDKFTNYRSRPRPPELPKPPQQPPEPPPESQSQFSPPGPNYSKQLAQAMNRPI